MTSAISGKIIYKQGERAYLDANIRPNSLVFDLTNNRLLYSPSGTSYYEFYPGPHSSGTGVVSGAVDWVNILNKPVASISTSGVLTQADWVTFFNKADVSAIPSTSGFALISSLLNYYPLSSTGNISGLTSPAQTQINSLSGVVDQLALTSGSGTVSAVDWSIIQNEPIASNSTSGVLTQADWQKFNAKADLSAIPSGSNGITSANFNENSRIVILNSATSNVSTSNINSATNLPFYMGGYRSKYFYISGTSSGSYSATIVFNGAKSNDVSWNVDNDISATITNNNNFVDAIYVNNLTKWSGSMTILSGTIPSPGVIAYVEG